MHVRALAGLIVFFIAVDGVTAVEHPRNPLIPPALYAVQAAPFTATIESVWQGTETAGPGRQLTKVVRDSAGRQRFEFPEIEQAAATGQPSSIVIYDVVRERMIKLDPEHKTATITRMEHMGRPVKIDPSVNSAVPDHPAKGGEYLGIQQIAGQEAWGEHLVRTYHYPDGHIQTLVRDLWLSTVYKMPLMQVREDVRLGRLTQQVIRFEAGEPDGSLFEVPSGYAVH